MTAVLDPTLKAAVALVTGASGGIGGAICAALAAAGARVIATDLGEVPDDTKFDTWMRHDVTSADDWACVIEKARDQYSRLDCLINSAGICPLESISDVSLEQWRRVMSVNVESILLGLQAAHPLLRESGKDRVGGSSIVNMSSTAGIRGAGFAAAYSASKGAVTLLTASAAKEFAALKYPIRVNSVHPGTVDSSMMELNLKRVVELGRASTVEAAREGYTSRNPMGRMAQAEEIAGAVVFLCSPAASYITGSKLVIDGGITS